MVEIRFYHLTSTPLERALPQLMERAYSGGFRVVIKTSDEAAMDRLNLQLWTFHPGSFLPHGSRKDGDASKHPLYITDADENPNMARLLAVTDGSLPGLTGYERVLDLFDGNDESAVSAARERWKTYKSDGHELQYWQQNEQGGWSQKA